MYAARHPTRGVINIDQPLDVAPFAEFVRFLADRLRGPDFPAVWQMFYTSFYTEVWPQTGHFPHLARPQQFARQLAATAH